MFNQGSNSALAEFVPEGLGVVAAVCGKTPQIARRNAGDLRADLRVVFLRGRAVNVGDVECSNIDEGGDSGGHVECAHTAD